MKEMKPEDIVDNLYRVADAASGSGETHRAITEQAAKLKGWIADAQAKIAELEARETENDAT